MEAERGEHDDRGDRNQDRQPDGPSPAQQQTSAGEDIGEAGYELEPQDDCDGVADGRHGSGTAEESLSAGADGREAEHDGDERFGKQDGPWTSRIHPATAFCS